MRYDPHSIEPKWQKVWREQNTFRAQEGSALPKYYVLDMFPYPSGSGLHVGHLVGYVATDIYARYMRQKGYNVLHPMGWDSFGLPAEQYAIRTGTHPAKTTASNIQNFRTQLRAVGFAYDWERELATSTPDYYKWTQWIFTKLYERNLAYQAELLVNYCPALGTVLANEEVEEGRSKEGGHPVERRPLKQWVLRITEYADRLLEDLEELDWPEGLKRLQRNWIGRSEGAHIQFSLQECPSKITVFTTRPDTLPAVTFLVLSPEHPLLKEIVPKSHLKQVEAYQLATAAKSDLERTELAKTKSGVFTGAHALHPLTQQPLPIWIADYVLMGYGTGAIMAVPSDDERDAEFAAQYDLPVGPKVGLPTEESKEKMIAYLMQHGKGERAISYKLRDWLFSRQRYWGEPFPILYLEDGSMRALTEEELPLCPPDLTDFKPENGESPLARVREWVEIVDPQTGKRALRETQTMPQWAGSCWYYLRFCDPHNKERAWDPQKERYWMPVDLYVGGAEHAVLHLLYARFWHKVLFDCGLVSTKEPFQRLLNQGMVVARSYRRDHGSYVDPSEVVEREGAYFDPKSGERLISQIEKMSKSKLNGIAPDEVIAELGADSLRLYTMFMGPIDKEKVWSIEGVQGCRRFLNRFYEMALSDKVQDQEVLEGVKLAHKLVRGVTEDLEKMLLNTAISKMMEFLNLFQKLPSYPKEAVRMAVLVLAPFAPHMAEELWQALGGTGSVSNAPWPKADPAYLVEETVTYMVQVNGKIRGQFALPKGQSQEQLLELAQAAPQIAKFLTGPIQKVILIPDKLLSIVL